MKNLDLNLKFKELQFPFPQILLKEHQEILKLILQGF